MLRTWFTRLFQPKPCPFTAIRSRRPRPSSYTLRLEQLEDRLAPAVFAVTADLHVLPLTPTAAPASHVVFVESSVPQAAMLLAGLAPDTDGVLLDAKGDGLSEMATFLASRHGLTAIDVVAHGQSGAISLGALTLDEATLVGAKPELAVLAAALGGEGSLDLWSCDVAAGSAGQIFVNGLAAATGGNVAAASHLVGAATLGGSWQLDDRVGSATAASPFTAAAQQAFDRLLLWSAAGNLNIPRDGATATLLNNGKVLVAGGFDNGPYLSTAELYNPATNTWTYTANNMNVSRGFATATLLNNGKVLVAGGFNNSNGYLSTAELYDPSTNAWSYTGSLSFAREYASATLLNNGKVLVAGGFNNSNGYLSTAELYDPSNNTWSLAGNMVFGGEYATATLLNNGKVLVAGGFNGSYLSTGQLYDPSTSTWSPTATPMSTPRGYATATLLNNGMVLVAGGDNSSGYLATAELYNPSTNGWAPTGAMSAARASATATLLPNQVLVAGGTTGGNYLSSAELYNQTTSTWSSTATPLTTGRDYATATLLNNGQVLVAGGLGNSGYLSSAELFSEITTTDATFKYGTSASTTVVAWSDSPPSSPSFTATNLPSWATLNATTGVLSGTPTAASSQTITVTASSGSTVITSSSFTLTVKPTPLTITADNEGREYGAAEPAFTASYNGFLNGDTSASLTGALTFSSTDSPNSSPGGYSIGLNGPSSTNYTISFVPGTLTVGTAPLTITADDQSKFYDQANPTLTVSYSGFVLGEGSANLAGVLSIVTPATTGSSVGPYAITPSGLTSSNYAITFATGTLTVTPAPLTILVADRSKVYGQPNPTFASNYLGFVNGDTAANLTGALSVTTTATSASAAGDYPINASGVSSANYTITVFAGNLTVNPAPLVVAANSQFQVYGQINPTFTASYAGFVNGDTSTSLTGTLSLNTTATASSGAGTYPVTANGLTSANYSITFLSGTLFVMPAPLTVTADDQTKVVGQANPAFTASYNGFVNGDSAGSLGGSLSFSTPATIGSGVGTYPITPSGVTAPNYSIFFVNGRLAVAAVATNGQTIAFTPLVDPIAFGVGPITLSASATSGLPVSFSVVSGPGSVNGNTLTVTGAGNIVVEADQSGSGQYAAAAPVQQTLVVLQAADAITFGPIPLETPGVTPFTLNAVGGGSSNPVVYTVLLGPGRVNGSTLTVTGLGAILIEATQAGDANYVAATPVFQTVLVETAQTIAFTQPTSPVTFGVGPITLSASASSKLPIFFSVISGPGTVNGSKLTVTGAGSIVIEADQAGNRAFAAAPPVQRTLVVNKANQTITFNLLSPVAYSVSPITLGAAASSHLPISYTVVSGLGSVTGNQLTISGIGPIVITASQAGNANYNAATLVQRTLVVNKANQTITFNAINPVTYGATPITLGATASSGLQVSYSVVSGHGSISGNQLTITGAGSIVIKATQAGNGNYSAATAITRTLTVNKGTLIVTANDATWTAGMAGQHFAGFTITGFVNGDTQALLFGSEAAALSCPTVNVNNPAANTYAILITQGILVTPANYNLTFKKGTLTVQ